MSPISSAASQPIPVATFAKPRPVDADGDHDGTRPAAVAPKPAAPALATVGSIGRQINTTA